jgi:hypothetical protein
VAGSRVAAIVGLIAVTLAATASAAAAPRLYTVAATEACLKGLRDAIVGLPPATPPAAPALFVYSYPRSRLLSPMHGQIGAWYARGKDTYEEVTFAFFKTAQSARAFLKSPPVWRGSRPATSRALNVLVGWDHPSVSGVGSGRAVRRCLRAVTPPGETVPTRPTPKASLSTFAGHWGGHTRALRISARGRGVEGASAGCCHPAYYVTFQILSVGGTLTRATATYRVTSFKRYYSSVTRLHVGQVGKLHLRNGIVWNNLTADAFCSDPAWGATGFCGA